jgi:transcriptional regulator with XRE-family HTH domain
MSRETEIFAQNLIFYMDRSGKSQVDLIRDLGVNRSTISTWYNGKKMPRMGTIQTLADYFGIMKSDLIEENISDNKVCKNTRDLKLLPPCSTMMMLPAWASPLVNAYVSAPPLKQEAACTVLDILYINPVIPSSSQGFAEHPKPLSFSPAGNQETIILLEPSVSACAGNGNYLEGDVEYKEIEVMKNIYTQHATYIVRLQGDSMEPEFRDGDRLIVKDAVGENPLNGRVGVFIVNNNAFLRQPLNGALHAYNPAYEDIKLEDCDDIRYIGYVVGTLDEKWVIK